MTDNTKKNVCKACGSLLAVGAPLSATLVQFPLWIEQGSKQTMSGTVLVLAIASSVPLFKQLKGKLKNPSAFVLWGILFGILALLAPIIKQLYVVALTGFVSNGGSVLLYKLSERFGVTEVKEAKNE